MRAPGVLRARPRDDQGCPRRERPLHRRGHRPAQPRRRPRGQPARSRHELGAHPHRLHRGLPPVRRRRLGRGALPRGLRRRWLPVARRHRHAGAHLLGEHGLLHGPAAHPGRHRPADAPRRRGAEGALPQEDGDGGVDRHHEPHRAAGRLRRGGRAHQGRARGRRQLPHHRHEDLHLLRRPRHGRQHRPPGARPGARCASRHQGHLVLHRAEVPPERGRLHRRAQRRRVRVDRAQDGHQGQPHLRHELRRERRRRRRLPHRRGQPGHALHVHDDEQRPALGGVRGPRPRRAGLPGRPPVRAGAPAGPGAGRPRGGDLLHRRAPRRGAGCCSP